MDAIDKRRIAVAGHSRLGKTALWCAAQDERFAAVFSNDSGCSGAAITRGKVGEQIQNITEVFPYWFCSNYAKYANHEDEMPFDQHQLLACIAPRLLYVASAAEDEWADPYSEYLACVAASTAYQLLGQKGLVLSGQAYAPGLCLQGGSIGYHLRAGTHFLSRDDWQMFISFLDEHI